MSIWIWTERRSGSKPQHHLIGKAEHQIRISTQRMGDNERMDHAHRSTLGSSVQLHPPLSSDKAQGIALSIAPPYTTAQHVPHLRVLLPMLAIVGRRASIRVTWDQCCRNTS